MEKRTWLTEKESKEILKGTSISSFSETEGELQFFYKLMLNILESPDKKQLKASFEIYKENIKSPRLNTCSPKSRAKIVKKYYDGSNQRINEILSLQLNINGTEVWKDEDEDKDKDKDKDKNKDKDKKRTSFLANFFG